MPHEITQCYLPPGRGDIPAGRLCKERIDEMTSAGEIEKCFRNNPELLALKKREAASEIRRVEVFFVVV